MWDFSQAAHDYPNHKLKKEERFWNWPKSPHHDILLEMQTSFSSLLFESSLEKLKGVELRKGDGIIMPSQQKLPRAFKIGRWWFEK